MKIAEKLHFLYSKSEKFAKFHRVIFRKSRKKQYDILKKGVLKVLLVLFVLILLQYLFSFHPKVSKFPIRFEEFPYDICL